MCGSLDHKYLIRKEYRYIFENGIVYVQDLIDRGYTVKEAVEKYVSTLKFLDKNEKATLMVKLYSYLIRNSKESRADKRIKIAIEVLENLMEGTQNQNIKTITLLIIEELKQQLIR